MKKIFILAFALVLLAGCGKQAQNSGGQDKGVFSSIRDAINKSITLHCDYIDEDGQKTVTYIKGQAIRMMESDNKDGSISFNGLVKDDKFYIWSGNSKDGAVMDMNLLKNSSDVKMGETQIHGTDDIINKLEEKKNNCRQEAVAASMFEVPADIQFSNFGNTGK